MARKSKTPEEAAAIGSSIRRARKELGFVLEDIQEAIGVNVGQLSRIEQGQFKTESPNLQKVQAFLQKHRGKTAGASPLVARFSNLLEKSPRHAAAAEAIVAAIEALV